MEIPVLGDVPWWVLLITLVVTYCAYSCRDFGYFYKQGIPCAFPLPILGTMYQMFFKDQFKNEKEGTELAKKRGCFGSFLGSSPLLVVHDEEMISQILVKEFPSFMTRMNFETGTLNDLMLSAMTGTQWKHTRNEMTPSFTTGKLKRMFAEVNRCAESMVNSLMEAAKSGEMVEMKEYMGAFTMDVIASTAFGIQLDSQKDKDNVFIKHARSAFDFDMSKDPMMFLRFIIPSLHKLLIKMGYPLRTMPKVTEDFFFEITKKAFEMRGADDDKSRTDFLQLMIKAQRGESIRDEEDQDQGNQTQGTGLSTDTILANALLFFIVGYETTSSSLSFFMHSMAVNPDCQAKLVEEIDQVIGNKDIVDYSFLYDMPYLEKCVQENLRMYPLGLHLQREATRDVTIKDIFIRKGMNIAVSVYGIHHDPAKWPEPDKFDPERFSPEKKKDRSPYHYLPFGNGPRNCIAMRLALLELKVAAIQVLRKFKVTTCEKTQNPLTFSSQPGFMKPEKGIWLKMVPRKAE